MFTGGRSPSPKACSNLFTSTHASISKRAVGLRLKGLLVYKSLIWGTKMKGFVVFPSKCKNVMDWICFLQVLCVSCERFMCECLPGNYYYIKLTSCSSTCIIVSSIRNHRCTLCVNLLDIDIVQHSALS